MQRIITGAALTPDANADSAAARLRLLQYLQALHYPAAEAAQLADQALAQAEACQPAELQPAAIAALQQLLPTQEPTANMPVPQRQSMAPEPLERNLRQLVRTEVLSAPSKAVRRLPWLSVLGMLLVLGHTSS